MDNLREVIENALKSHLDLKQYPGLLDELIAAFDAARKSLPAAPSREWRAICAANIDREQAEQVMLVRLEKALGITPNGRPEWDKIARFLIEKERQGGPEQTIEVFAKKCMVDPYSTPKTHQIAKDPMQIKMNWLHVMEINKPKDYTAGVPEEETEISWEQGRDLLAVEIAWKLALDQLQLDMPKGTFDVWVKDTTPLSYQDGMFTVGASSDKLPWLENRLKSTVTRLLAGILNAEIEIQFVEANQ